MGPNGLRAGWRLLIFFAILVPLGIGAGRIIDLLLSKLQADMYTPLGGLAVMGTLVIALLLASNIMARIERRRISDFGLPWRRAFCRQFWQGAAISFSSLTALLFVLWLAGAFSFGSPALHGADIWKYGALWTLPLFLSALFEDFLYRGYLLFTLTSGIGFWPAALVTSLLMGGAHYFNPGGHGLGPLAAFLYCLATCVVIRRTGDLWMALESTRNGRGAKSFSTAYLPAGFRARNILLMPASTVPHGLPAARSGRKQVGPVSRC